MKWVIKLYYYIIYFNRLDIILQHSSMCTPRKSTKKVGEKLNARLIMKVGNTVFGGFFFTSYLATFRPVLIQWYWGGLSLLMHIKGLYLPDREVTRCLVTWLCPKAQPKCLTSLEPAGLRKTCYLVIPLSPRSPIWFPTLARYMNASLASCGFIKS